MPEHPAINTKEDLTRRLRQSESVVTQGISGAEKPDGPVIMSIDSRVASILLGIGYIQRVLDIAHSAGVSFDEEDEKFARQTLEEFKLRSLSR